MYRSVLAQEACWARPGTFGYALQHNGPIKKVYEEPSRTVAVRFRDVIENPPYLLVVSELGR